MSTLKSRSDSQTLVEELAQLSPVVTHNIVEMRRAAYLHGEVPPQFKLLAAVAISVALRCEPCIRAYVEWAGKKGASKQDLVEFLNVAMAMQGCPGEEWSLKALRAWDELIDGGKPQTTTPDGGDGCCSV